MLLLCDRVCVLTPITVCLHTYLPIDLHGKGAKMHEEDKRPLASRLAKSSAYHVYGLEQHYDSHGPFPIEFKAINEGRKNQLLIVYDRAFKYEPQKGQSGLYIEVDQSMMMNCG